MGYLDGDCRNDRRQPTQIDLQDGIRAIQRGFEGTNDSPVSACDDKLARRIETMPPLRELVYRLLRIRKMWCEHSAAQMSVTLNLLALVKLIFFKRRVKRMKPNKIWVLVVPNL
jgi:hypothetical protein